MLSNRLLNTSEMYGTSRKRSNSTLTICANGYGCISKNFGVLSPLAMLLHLNNAKFSSLKRLEMEKAILKQWING
ncbi:Uncharacterised protein [Yersinia pseudotuberculosis]|nr:Uncharacterised protein [Yersinia pseudotuberculosis]